MRTLKLTSKDFKTVNDYREYTGKEDLYEVTEELKIALKQLKELEEKI